MEQVNRVDEMLRFHGQAVNCPDLEEAKLVLAKAWTLADQVSKRLQRDGRLVSGDAETEALLKLQDVLIDLQDKHRLYMQYAPDYSMYAVQE